jgi:hypothetical protein
VSELLAVGDSCVGVMDGSGEVFFYIMVSSASSLEKLSRTQIWLMKLIVSGKSKCTVKYTLMVKTIFQLAVA